jgi:glutamine amidotransferase
MQSDEFVIDKEPIKATCSEHLKDILSHPVVGKNVFAHIRLATVGEIISPNCHPFTEADDNNRSWMLIHNGTIFDYPKLDEYKDKESGDTDSERILLYIIDKINEFEKSKGSVSTIKERFNILTEIVEDLSRNNKLNLMIYDGDLTYIHSNMRNSLYYLKDDESFLVATTPLTDDENWKPVELNKLFGLIDGNIIFESAEHENEFILTEEHEKAIEEFLNSINRDDVND